MIYRCLLALLPVISLFAAEPAVIVTCASGELGSAIARKLASENRLILAGRNLAKLEQLQKEFPDASIVQLDYTDPMSLEAFGKSLEGESISGFVLIGPRPNFGSDLLQGEAQWFQLLQATFTGPLEALKKALPNFTDSGKIVIVGGTTSVQLMPEYGPACVVRRMWTACSKALSHQLGPKGIHVNMISPSIVLTNHHIDRIKGQAEKNGIDYEDQMEKDTARIPLRRHADPEEVAQAARFLLSKESNFITGTNLLIDGGASTTY